MICTDTFERVLCFFHPAEAQRILSLPLSKLYMMGYTFNENVWRARCVGETWRVPVHIASSGHQWRSLYLDLVYSLSLVEGTNVVGSGEEDNVLAVASVLDHYRGLQEMTRACFSRLGNLLQKDAARETIKTSGLRIMDHALWALRTFHDDVDIQLKVLRFVVLAGRPIGGTEGMVFHRGRASGGALEAFGPTGEGVAAVLATMSRHLQHGPTQAMACWSMVNMALLPVQKENLIRLGGIKAVTSAMVAHPKDPEVLFRGMFALINLVTPDGESVSTMPTDTMKDVVAVVLAAIHGFSENAAIVNRGCLVLHNIALDAGHFETLLAMGAPQHLVQAVGKHPTDVVLCQCVSGTLRRLGAEATFNSEAPAAL
ncbi:unnamed protein product [Discosporangium mesarthrocarpum]